MNRRGKTLALALWLAAVAVFGAPPESDLHIRPERMAEWNAWRFGLFIHWGPWSQTGIGYIWKIAREDPPGAREQRFELWRTFNPTRFDPRKWARAAKDAGMKYVVFVVKHHDGFNNYDTAFSDFKITHPASPFAQNPNADLTRAVVEAFRAEGLAIGLYYSHIDWHHPDGRFFSHGHWDYDPGRIDRDPASWRRFADYEKSQVRELLTRYGKIDIVWFDIMWPFAVNGTEPISHPVVRADALDLLAKMKRAQPDVIFNDRGTDIYGGFHTPEQRIPETAPPGNWETSLTITNERGFWFKGDGVSAKSPAELVRVLIDIASKGGNLLLNVGPRPDGELTAGEYEALSGIGSWMKLYGDTIYATTRSHFLELPWGRSTTKDRTLFLHVFDWPRDGMLVVPGLRNRVKSAWRAADPLRRPLAVTARGDDRLVAVGATPDNEIASVIALEIDGAPDVKNLIRQRDAEPVVLGAARATIAGGRARYQFDSATRHGDFIEGLAAPADRLMWAFWLVRAGRYRIDAEYAVQPPHAGGTFVVCCDDQPPLAAKTIATADWEGALLDVRAKDGTRGETFDNRWTFRTVPLGAVSFAAPGEHTVALEPRALAGNHLFFLKSLTLHPLGPEEK